MTELIFLMLFSVPLWLLFRHGPATPDLRFSECFVAMVYIINMLLIFNILLFLIGIFYSIYAFELIMSKF